MNAAYLQTFPPVSFLDRGISDEAREVRRLRDDIQKSDNSFYSVKKQAQIVQGLSGAYKDASTDNWDGYQAFKAEPSALPYAFEFLNLLPLSTPFPEIAIDNYGEIAIEWDYGSRKVISIRVGKDGTLTFAALDGYNSVHGVETLQDAIPETIALWMDRVTTSDAA